MENLKAVIFDFDGVLVDSLSVWIKVDHDVFNKFNIPLDTIEEFEQEIAGMNLEAVAGYYIKRYGVCHANDEVCKIIRDLVVDNFRCSIKPKKGVIEFLDFLSQKQIKVAIASSNDNDLINMCLEANNMSDYFEKIITSSEVDNHKPHPDVYLKAAHLLCVEPKDCLVFEDTLFGVLAGKNAGMKVYGIYDSFNDYCLDEIKKNCDQYFIDFEEVIKFFKN